MSADDYHKIIECLVEHNFPSIFKLKNNKNETAIHNALEKLELKNETLQILACQYNVNFNNKNNDGKTELVSAILGGRSVRLLKTLVQLGADINPKGKYGCGVLCRSIESKNIETLKHFLSLGLNPNRRCYYFANNIWGHALFCANEPGSFTISEVAMLLMQNGTDINSATMNVHSDEIMFSLFKSASILLKESNLEPNCITMLNEKQSFLGNTSSCMCNLCFWSCCWCCFLTDCWCDK